MKKIGILLLSACVVLTAAPVATAVEGGSDASGNAIVVPLIIEVSPGKFAGCSGALLMPSVVVTAGHCLLDANGQGSQNVRVGPPGSSANFDDKTWATVNNSNFSVDYQGSGINGTVGKADIAVVTINKIFPLPVMVTIASENQLLAIKAASSKLKIYGYGYTTDAGAPATGPNTFDAIYSQQNSFDPNQSFAESTDANACAGDSGGPVLYTTPTRVMLIGVVTGSFFSNKCSKKQANGKYLTGFSIINRFANLAIVSATQAFAMEMQVENQMTAKIAQLQADALKAKDDYNFLQNSMETSISELKSQIEILKRKLPSTIYCLKGKVMQKIFAVSPKCPAGFKIKSN